MSAGCGAGRLSALLSCLKHARLPEEGATCGDAKSELWRGIVPRETIRRALCDQEEQARRRGNTEGRGRERLGGRGGAGIGRVQGGMRQKGAERQKEAERGGRGQGGVGSAEGSGRVIRVY